jgi:hypothetical protein
MLAAELHLGGAAGDTEHLVNAGMIVYVVVNPVPPGLPPTVSLEELFEHGGRIEVLGEANGAAIDNQGPTRMVGNDAVILEVKGVCIALPQEFGNRGAGRSCPSSQPFGTFFTVSSAGILFPLLSEEECNSHLLPTAPCRADEP